MKKTGLFVLVIISMLLTSCASRMESQAVTIILDWTVNTNHTGLYAALEKGYFKEAGLDVTIQAPPETGALQLMASGNAQFCISYQEEITYAKAADLPVVALAAVIQHNSSGFASRKGAGITSPKDFEGKKYGGWGSPMEEAMLKALMDRYNADYNALEIVSVGSMDFFAATEQSVDFTWIFEGWDGVAAELRDIDINYIALKDELPVLDYYTPVIAGNSEYVIDNQDTVKAFMKAVSQGYEYVIANPEEGADILMKYAPELDKDLVVASQKYLAAKYKDDAVKWGVMKENVWIDYAAWMFDQGLLEKKIEPRSAFTNLFLP